MTENSTNHFSGYEWGMQCGECGDYNNMSGMFAADPIVNGEEVLKSAPPITDDTTIECGNCGHTVTVRIEDVA
ncbi:hypothetical protein SAMN05421858_5066 [Haladaptatus litoreus]|uniref:Uncharacterized protein n=1 Tax=Haladaptatus litoreus TaxID=553468 RepID=A0A1N7FHU7_9EURY|nr:hypothetical protein [Haladaptatus litoreus]SIR99805.1 hypothetical protein SAMN05421858_5066 [Haladaptatus litoreus]